MVACGEVARAGNVSLSDAEVDGSVGIDASALDVGCVWLICL